MSMGKNELKEYILYRATSYAKTYPEPMQRVAYDSYIAGMEALSEIIEDKDNEHIS